MGVRDKRDSWVAAFVATRVAPVPCQPPARAPARISQSDTVFDFWCSLVYPTGVSRSEFLTLILSPKSGKFSRDLIKTISCSRKCVSSLRGFNGLFRRTPPRPAGGQTFRFPSFLFLGLAWLASHSKPLGVRQLFASQVIQTGCAYGASSCLPRGRSVANYGMRDGVRRR